MTLLRAFSSKSFAVSRWNSAYFSGEMGKVALVSLGGTIDSECQRRTNAFLACRSLAGHTSVVAAESVGVSLALDVAAC